jgi:membrane-bound lytic murein transglycosylase B
MLRCRFGHGHSVVIGRHRAARSIAFLLLTGLFCSQVGVAAQAQPSLLAPRVLRDAYADHIAEASQRFGIPEFWIDAVLQAESAGDGRAISSAGAMGLMQIMPATWSALRQRHGLGRDPYDPRDNILAGAAYLRAMFDRYGNVAAMLAAYNAGPGRYDEYLSAGRVLPAETRAYVAKLAPILGNAAPSHGASMPAALPPDWREAPLFVARGSNRTSAIGDAASVQGNDTRTPVPDAVGAPDRRQHEAIFVTQADSGAAP